MKTKQMSAKTLVMGAVMTALVIILQYLGSFIKLGTFSISLVLIPIVIGTATCGKGIGAWLGFVFGVVVLLSGDATPFMTVNAPGTIITVLLKGTACGFIAGLAYQGMYKLLKGNSYLSTVVTAIVCPIVNTGIFLLGCKLFFVDKIIEWTVEANLGGGVAHYIIFGLGVVNFLPELAINIIFSPIIVRIINVVKKS